MQQQPISLQDHEPDTDSFLDAVLAGLSKPRKELPTRFLYDQRGSELFDRICEADEYYPTRTEMTIMRRYIDEMTAAVGPRALIVEYGSGSSLKTRLLLDHLEDPAAYVPLDISKEHLLAAAESIAADYPELEVLPVCADFTRPFTVPKPSKPAEHTVVYFPGSTIGNFAPESAIKVLRQVADLCGRGGGLLMGVDVYKDEAILRAAYNDREGITAAFNLNILERINRELGGDFNVDAFEHRAVFNPEHSRMDMLLISKQKQLATIDGENFNFDEGETICTEYSYKHPPERFARIAAEAGLEQQKIWTDENRLFSIQYFTVR